MESSGPSHSASDRSSRPLIIACCIFLLATLVAAFLVVQSERDRLRRERTLISGYAKDHAQLLEVHVERALSACYALAALVRVGNGGIPNFDAVAGQMLPLYPGASELVLSVGGKIQHVAPLRGNEKAIGLDLLSYPEQKAEASISRDTGKLTLAGPLELVQGGLALAGRLPVFLNATQGTPAFWGFTEVVMRLPEALAPAQLSQLVARGYDYELWRINPVTGRKQIIDASSHLGLIDPVEQTLQVPNSRWTLSIAPAAGWGDRLGLGVRMGLGLSFSLLLAYLAQVLSMLKARSEALGVLVARRTTSIVAAKNHLKAILDAIPDLVWLKDADGHFLSCNPPFERYFGAHEEQILGRTDYDFVSAKLADAFRENDRKAMVADKPRVNEEWLRFADSGYRGLFETIKTPMRDSQGSVIGVLGIARDITARKRAERAARKSKTRLSVILEAAQVSLWDWNISRDRWYASRSYFTSLGYKPEPGQPDREVWLSRVHPDDRLSVRRKIEHALTGSANSYEYEARILHADGTYRWVSVRGKVVERDSRGLATRMLGVRYGHYRAKGSPGKDSTGGAFRRPHGTCEPHATRRPHYVRDRDGSAQARAHGRIGAGHRQIHEYQ